MIKQLHVAEQAIDEIDISASFRLSDGDRHLDNTQSARHPAEHSRECVHIHEGVDFAPRDHRTGAQGGLSGYRHRGLEGIAVRFKHIYNFMFIG